MAVEKRSCKTKNRRGTLCILWLYSPFVGSFGHRELTEAKQRGCRETLVSPRPSHPREANCRDDHGVDGPVWELFGTLLRVKGLEKDGRWVSSEDNRAYSMAVGDYKLRVMVNAKGRGLNPHGLQ